jgi:hypothetical protein
MLMYNYIYIVKIEPRTIHAWRQFDCLSFAQNFYNGDASLYEPRINNLSTTGTGKTAGEFPIIPYIVALIWKITGMNSSVFKLVNLFFLIAGLFYIYKLFLLEFKDKIVAGLAAGLMFTSPILSYYGVSTINDIPSFSLSAIGFYFFYKYLKENNFRSFLMFILLFSLAGLIKASAAFTFAFCGILFLVNKFSLKEPIGFLKNQLKEIMLFCLPVIAWLSWYLFAYAYNARNVNNAFLLGIWPIWGFDQVQISTIFRKFFFDNLHELLHPIVLCFLSTLVLLSFRKFKSSTNKITVLLALLLFLVFIIFFYGAINVHDYYFINPFMLIVAIFFFALKEWREIVLVHHYKRFIAITSVSILAFSYISGQRTWLKINDNVQNFNNVIALNADERKNFFWIYWIDRENYKALEKKEFNLDSIGIKKDDPILCLGDETPNRSLYLLNRKGYSGFNTGLSDVPAFLKIHPEVKFLVLVDPHLKKEVLLKDVLINKVFEKESLSIYKVN